MNFLWITVQDGATDIVDFEKVSAHSKEDALCIALTTLTSMNEIEIKDFVAQGGLEMFEAEGIVSILIGDLMCNLLGVQNLDELKEGLGKVP